MVLIDTIFSSPIFASIKMSRCKRAALKCKTLPRTRCYTPKAKCYANKCIRSAKIFHRNKNIILFEHDLATSKVANVHSSNSFFSLPFDKRNVLQPFRRRWRDRKRREKRSVAIVFSILLSLFNVWKCVWLVPKERKFNQKIILRMI